jgi:ribosome-binding factor A
MPPDHRRSERVAEGIREEVATFLAEDAKDPRIVGLVTVTGVDVTRDLRHAKVFVSIMGSDVERQATLEGLDSAAGHLRSRIGRALRLRVAPEITFRYDDSIARAAKIEALLAGLRDPPPTDDDGERG